MELEGREGGRERWGEENGSQTSRRVNSTECSQLFSCFRRVGKGRKNNPGIEKPNLKLGLLLYLKENYKKRLTQSLRP